VYLGIQISIVCPRKSARVRIFIHDLSDAVFEHVYQIDERPVDNLSGLLTPGFEVGFDRDVEFVPLEVVIATEFFGCL
jgi:hypothetical protein